MNPCAPETTRLGWVGTGVMGTSMCGHLLRAGYAVTLTTRTRSKAESLIAAGARWVDTPAEVVEDVDVVATMLGVPADVRSVYFGAGGVLANARPGTVLVDFTTTEPALAAEIHACAQRRDVWALDAPVSGGDVGARNATLSIMVGGDRAVFEALEKLWALLGNRSVYQGSAGAGQHTKMVNQILIASGMVGVCEALLYGYKAGLDLERVLESVSSGAAGSWSLSNLGPRMLAGEFAPGFLVEHFIKDMRIALGEADRLGLALPGLALAHQLYRAVQAQGHGRSGTHALQLALASLSGIDWSDVARGRGSPHPEESSPAGSS
ncbi:MAG TPA: NAD(P)-dependent oxidoreductase [Polyangiaceae bacterium]|nr:NAD(P)-dependent oxidoreductase [Polyangiaceae bacterium]